MRAEHSGVVVQLPTSCAEAVQQSRKAGRYPKAIGRLGEARAMRNLAACKEEQARQEKIAEWERCWFDALRYLDYIEGKLHALGAEPPPEQRPILSAGMQIQPRLARG